MWHEWTNHPAKGGRLTRPTPTPKLWVISVFCPGSFVSWSGRQAGCEEDKRVWPSIRGLLPAGPNPTLVVRPWLAVPSNQSIHLPSLRGEARGVAILQARMPVRHRLHAEEAGSRHSPHAHSFVFCLVTVYSQLVIISRHGSVLRQQVGGFRPLEVPRHV